MHTIELQITCSCFQFEERKKNERIRKLEFQNHSYTTKNLCRIDASVAAAANGDGDDREEGYYERDQG